MKELEQFQCRVCNTVCNSVTDRKSCESSHKIPKTIEKAFQYSGKVFLTSYKDENGKKLPDLEKWRKFLDSKGYYYKIVKHDDYYSLKIYESCPLINNAFYMFFDKDSSIKN